MKIITWNINSVRLRVDLVCRLLQEQKPDVLCLQECKSPVDKIPLARFAEIGYPHMVASGQKGYNGVAILSKHPLKEVASCDFANLDHARHIAGQLENGLTVHNFYIPAGGDVADREANVKFGQKLDYISEVGAYFKETPPQKTIIVGDFNIAPREDDVWDHKKLLKVVSHTPIEVEALKHMQDSGPWVDVVRENIPSGKLYSWWSYRAKDWKAADKGRRLDHIWATCDIAPHAMTSQVLQDVRGWDSPSDHAPIVCSFAL